MAEDIKKKLPAEHTAHWYTHVIDPMYLRVEASDHANDMSIALPSLLMALKRDSWAAWQKQHGSKIFANGKLQPAVRHSMLLRPFDSGPPWRSRLAAHVHAQVCSWPQLTVAHPA